MNNKKVSTIVKFLITLLLIIGTIFLGKSFSANNEKLIIEGMLEKYINYNLENGESGTLVQYHIRTGIEYGDTFTPINNSNLEIDLSSIDGVYPDSVKVITISTKATNGKTTNIVENYNYDAQTGKLIINNSNKNENNELISNNKVNKDDRDEFIIICYYNTYTEEVSKRELVCNVRYDVTFDAEDQRKVFTTGSLKTEAEQNIGELTSVSLDTEEVYNGYIKSNIINGTTYNTNYVEKNSILISKKNAQEKLKITQENEYVNKDDIFYKSTTFKKEDILNVLGEEGKIEILDSNNNVLFTIDNNTEFNENGEYNVTYGDDVNNIIIKTSNIINEGFLNIENEKYIKSDNQNIDDKEIKTITKVSGINEEEIVLENEEEGSNNVEIVENTVYETNNEKNVVIKNSTANVELSIDNSKWTNKEQNNVTFDVNLSSLNMKDNLFNNPTLRIKLPNEVEKVVLNNSSIVYNNGLEMQEPYIETDENGNLVIVVNLNGIQNTYNENNLGLKTNIKLSTTVILKKDIESTLGKVNLEYTNNYSVDGTIEQGNFEKVVTFENYKEETINKVENTEKQEDIISTINNAVQDKIEEEIKSNATQEQIDALNITVEPVKGDTVLNNGDTVYESEFIKFNIKVENTSTETINNVRLVGTIPEGITYGELNSKFNSLTDKKYEYNYDENLTEKEIEIGTINPGQTIDTYYEVRVDGLNDDEAEKPITTNIKTYIDDTEVNSQDLNYVIKQAEADVYVTSQVEGPKGEWSYRIYVNNYEGKNATIKLNLDEFFYMQQEDIDNKNVYVQGYDTNGNYMTGGYTREFNGTELIINTSQSGSFFLGVQEGDRTSLMDRTSEGKIELKAVASLTIDDITYKSNENRLDLPIDDLTIKMSSENEGEEVEYGEEINYNIQVTGYSSNLEGEVGEVAAIYTHITDYLPEDVEPISVTYDYYEKITQDIGTGEDAGKVAIGITEKQTKTENIVVKTDEDGNKMPEIDITTWIPLGETININVKTKAKYLYERTEIENSAVATINIEEDRGSYVEFSRTSNIVKHTILPYEETPLTPENPDDPDTPVDPDDPDIPVDPDDPDNPDEPVNPDQRHIITGVVWNDTNVDGERQNTENLVPGIEVLLVNLNDSGNVLARTSTNSNGRYTFSDLEQGNYIVIFRYNTLMYTLTEYRRSGVSDDVNSDATNQTITLDGQSVNVGVTDTINLTKDTNNLDLGLISKKGYDLKLDKYITDVSVTTNNGTKQYAYDNTKIGRVEIRAKEIEGAFVEVKYKIVVTNEGESSVTIREIYDYLPEGLEFSTTGNSNWTNNNGTLVNRSLMNQEIGPGESREITLTLTKTMTENSSGTFTNAAEIGSVGTTTGIEDADSTPGNRNRQEDDYSEAQLIIGVSTGLVTYISIGAMVLTILVLIGLAIKFKVKIGKISKLGIFLMIFSVVSICTSSNVFGVWFHFIDSENHEFEGGPTGTGYCAEHGLVAAGWNWAGCDHSETDYAFYENWGYMEYGVKQYTSDAIDLRKTNDQIGVKKIGDNYILGPFESYSNSTENYIITITDKVGNRIDGWAICDANGAGVSLPKGVGNVTFYLSLSDSLYARGVSKVTVNQNKTRSYTQERWWHGQRYYAYVGVNPCQSNQDQVHHPDGPYNHQGVYTSTYDFDHGTDYGSEVTTGTIEWTNFNATLDIIKVDADDLDVKLDISGTLTKTDGSWSQEFTTQNGRYHFDNLSPGNYIIKETANNNYGYEQNVTKELTVYTYSGETFEVYLTNTKETGILEIDKSDLNIDKPMANVGFKIRNSDGQYIIAIDENGERQSEVTGEIYLGNMETTSDVNEATLFVTNEEGKVTIYDIRVGTYTVEEAYLGDEHFNYDLDDEYVSWNNGSQDGTGLTATVEVTRQRSYDTSSDSSVIKDDRKTIDDGLYEIETGVGSNFTLDVSYAYSHDYSNVGIHTKNKTLAQMFYVKYLGNGLYRIIYTGADNSVDVNGGVVADGTNVQIYTNNDSNSQKWTIQSTGDGYYKIGTALNSNYYMDVNGGVAADMTNVQIWSANTSNAQKWKFNTLSEIPESGKEPTVLSYKNKKKYIKLNGLVWEDMISGKTSERDWVYSQGDQDETNPDKLVANVTVKLKDINGNDVEFKTEDGRKVTEILTDENGSYTMMDVLIDNLDEYYIEFSYNGMSYTSVPIVDLSPENVYSSKAEENAEERTTFNNNYSTITHSNSQEPIGESRNESGSKTYDLHYDETDHYVDETGAEIDQVKSTLNYGANSVYGYEGQRFPVNMTDEQYIIHSTTKDAYQNDGQTGYLSDMYTAEQIREDENDMQEINNINLGLWEREQPDLAVVEDIETAKVTLNGYEHTYKYSQRFNENQETDGFNVGVKFGNEYGSESYTRTIYSSDIVYNMQEGNEGKLEVYITYKVALRNEATNLYTRVNEVINYFDERYDVDSVTNEDGEALDYQVDNYNSNGFRKMTIETNQEIEPEKQELIYITYKLQNEAVNAVLNQDITLDSVTEIASYSSYSDENYAIHYAGVDSDSRPGSAIPEDKESYEDDTDSAPSLILEVSPEDGRIIRGTVWEDNALQELLANTGYDKQRKGDGYYATGENIVKDVKVALLTYTDEGNIAEVATLYHKNEVTEPAETTTDENGNYEFAGIIPGKYVIRYTYGNSSIIVSPDGTETPIETVEKYKSTIYRAGDKNGAEAMTDYWYRAETGEGINRMSDAKDETGINSDGTSYDIVAERTEESGENVYNYGNMSGTIDSTKLENIEADTRMFDIKLDYDVNLDNISEYGVELKFIFDNIDFGIIRRPIQNLDIRKEIAWVQVKLANGQVVIEGDPREGSINYLRYLPDGNIHIELDQELIQGATITIKYEIIADPTNCEIDYNNEDYYIYGIEPANHNNWKMATISNLYDYLSNGLVFDENNANNIANNWSQVELNRDLVTNGILSQEAYDAAQQFNQVLQTDAFKNMTPGQEIRVPLEVSRILSNSADNFMFTNDIEVNEVTGRKMEHDGDYTIPGNYEPSNGETGYDDDYVYLTITGPTGENRNYIQYIILGTIGLITLGAGIILIKKKVL